MTTTKITRFQRYEHGKVSTLVLDRLKALGDELGVDFSVGGGQIGNLHGRINLNVQVRETVEGKNAGQVAFNALCGSVGMPREAYGKTFMHKGVTFKITGINTGAWKFPVQAVRVHDNAPYKFPVDLVRSLIGLSNTNPAQRFA